MNRRQFLRSSIAAATGLTVAPIAMSAPAADVTATSIAMSNGPTIGDVILRAPTILEDDLAHLSQMMSGRMQLVREMIRYKALKDGGSGNVVIKTYGERVQHEQ